MPGDWQLSFIYPIYKRETYPIPASENSFVRIVSAKTKLLMYKTMLTWNTDLLGPYVFLQLLTTFERKFSQESLEEIFMANQEDLADPTPNGVLGVYQDVRQLSVILN